MVNSIEINGHCICLDYFAEPLKRNCRELVVQGNDLVRRTGGRVQDDHVTNICSFLAQNQDVVSVNLSHNEITDVGMKILANFLETNVSLKRLNVMCNNITWVSMEYLLSVGEDLELESLRLNGNRIGPVGGDILVKLLSCSTKLIHLDVGQTDLTFNNLWLFAKELTPGECEGSAFLKYLDLSRPLREAAYPFKANLWAHYVGQMLRVNQNLLELHMQKTEFTDHDIETLLEGLQWNQTLQCLDLSCNNIGDLGADFLAGYLRKGSELKALMLASNRIGDSGARALSFALPYTKMRLLDISYNKIKGQGIADILNSIKKPRPMISLFVFGNTISAHAAMALYRMLESKVLDAKQVDVRPYFDKCGCTYRVALTPNNTYRFRYYCINETVQPGVRKPGLPQSYLLKTQVVRPKPSPIVPKMAHRICNQYIVEKFKREDKKPRLHIMCTPGSILKHESSMLPMFKTHKGPLKTIVKVEPILNEIQHSFWGPFAKFAPSDIVQRS